MDHLAGTIPDILKLQFASGGKHSVENNAFKMAL